MGDNQPGPDENANPPAPPLPLCEVLNEIADAGATAQFPADSLRRMLLALSSRRWGGPLVDFLDMLRTRGHHDLIVRALLVSVGALLSSTPEDASADPPLLKTTIVEASQHPGRDVPPGRFPNHGKFLVAQFTGAAWAHAPGIGTGYSLLDSLGWTSSNLLVVDLATGEGAIFAPHGIASADLQKHAVWVCPLFEPFLDWLYSQPRQGGVLDVYTLPAVVGLPDARGALGGYRRPGLGRQSALLAELAAAVAEPQRLIEALAKTTDPDERTVLLDAFRRCQEQTLRTVLFPPAEIFDAGQQMGTAAMTMLIGAMTEAATKPLSDTALAVEMRRAQIAAGLQILAEVEAALQAEDRLLREKHG